MLGISVSAFAKSTRDGTMPNPFTSVGLIASIIPTFCVNTSYVPGFLLFELIANPVLALPWGSKSTTRHDLPDMDNAVARFTAVVVLPTPPF